MIPCKGISCEPGASMGEPTNSQAFILGIDPGLKGAYAVLNQQGQLLELGDMPTISITSGKKKRNKLDASELRDILTRVKPEYVVYEQQQAMPGQGVTSMFSTGYGFGIIEGLLVALYQRHFSVLASRWTKSMLVGASGEGKERSLQVAKGLYPTAERLNKTNGRADALLIALYGLTWITKGGDSE